MIQTSGLASRRELRAELSNPQLRNVATALREHTLLTESPHHDEEDAVNLEGKAEEDLLEEFNSYSSKLALQADSRALSEIRQTDEGTEFEDKVSQGGLQSSRLELEQTIKLEKNLDQLRNI